MTEFTPNLGQLRALRACARHLWVREQFRLDDAALEIQIDLELFESKVYVSNIKPEYEPFFERKLFDRFRDFLKEAGFPEWEPCGSALDGLEVYELYIAYALNQVGVLEWLVLEPMEDPTSEISEAIKLVRDSIDDALTAAAISSPRGFLH